MYKLKPGFLCAYRKSVDRIVVGIIVSIDYIGPCSNLKIEVVLRNEKTFEKHLITNKDIKKLRVVGKRKN